MHRGEQGTRIADLMATTKKTSKKTAAKSAPVPKKVAAKTAKKTAKKSAKSGGGPVAKRAATRARSVAKEPELPHDEGAAQAAAGKSLVIVESPAKAKTIGKYLGNQYLVRATVGHIRDLPVKQIGIDPAHGFEPQYVTIPGKEKTVAELKSAAKTAKAVFIATDPDREGEAIAWHVESQISGAKAPPIKRALFYEITKDAVRAALDEARQIDQKKVDAQQIGRASCRERVCHNV